MCDTNQVGPVPNVDFKLLKISCHEQTLNGYQGIRRHKSFVFPSAKTCMFFCWASQQATECKHSTWTFVVFLSSSVRDISKDILKNHKDQREGVPAWGLSYCSGSQLPMTTTKQQGPGWWISTDCCCPGEIPGESQQFACVVTASAATEKAAAGDRYQLHSAEHCMWTHCNSNLPVNWRAF